MTIAQPLRVQVNLDVNTVSPLLLAPLSVVFYFGLLHPLQTVRHNLSIAMFSAVFWDIKYVCLDSQFFDVSIDHLLCCVQGPIFDIQWDTSGTQLCSVSDDRSVRYWRLNRALSNSDPPVTLQRTSAGYGHTSRVWRCAFLSTDALTWVVSSGEDGTLRFWHAETGTV